MRVFTILVLVLVGFGFGAFLEKGRVFEPQLIREQMRWTKFLMLKMFLAAGMSSLLSFTVINLINPKKMEALRSVTVLPTTARTVVGCALLGAGMAISGACPGTVLAQLGSGVYSSVFTFFGGIAAGLIFTKFKEQILYPLQGTMGVKSGFLDKELGVSYYLVSLPLALMFFLVVLGIEYLVPWYTEYNVDQYDVFPSVTAVAWPPYFSGLCIGLLQLPLVLGFGKALGCSTSFEKFGGYVHSILGTAKSTYITKISTCEFDNYWQPCFLVGAMLGACISSVASGSFAVATPLPIIPSIIGGFLIIMGGRIAGGCTSGHGISGFSKLSLASFIAVPVMFASGTLTIFALDL